MDPVSVLALTNASLGIARSLVHTIKELYELAEAYETAALGIRTVATQCNSFRIAVQRINTWLTTQNESTRGNLDDDFWQALSDNLETGRLVLEDLEKRIQGLKKSPAKFWTRTKYLWNSTIISELQSQIQGLMSAVSILIQVIDIPTTGGKRSQSLAQRSRLNTLTMSVRMTVDQRRERIRKTQEQNLLDDIDHEPVPTNLQDPLPASNSATTDLTLVQASATNTQMSSRNDSANGLIQPQLTGSSTNDTAPPPYDYYENDLTETKSQPTPTYNDMKKSPQDVSTEQEGSFRVLDSSEIKDDKTKWSKWNLKFRKRSNQSKDQSLPPASSGSQDDKFKDSAKPATPPTILSSANKDNSHFQHTPAAIEPSEDRSEYFDLQQAMMGMSMPLVKSKDRESFPKSVSASEERSSMPHESYTSMSAIVTPPAEEGTTSLTATLFPNKTSQNERTASTSSLQKPARPTNERSKSSSNVALTAQDPAEPSYYPPRNNSADIYAPKTISPPPSSSQKPVYASPPLSNFNRIRPSHRVREARERSHSQGPARGTSTPDPAEPKLQKLTSTPSFSTSYQQNWRTTPATTSSSLGLSNSNALRLKVTFDPNSFTSRISTSAARALNVLDSAISIDNIPIATLTLLNTVDDGETQSVMGDEVELEVMHEEETRSAEIRFGADQMMLRELMEVGGYLYWSERAVPRGLRTVDNLRLFRRFELSMW